MRVQLNGDSRNMQTRIDDLGDKLRGCEIERNDLRTRLAADMRTNQLSMEEMNQKLRHLEETIQAQAAAHNIRESRLLQEGKDREDMLEDRHRLEQSNALGQQEDQHRQ